MRWEVFKQDAEGKPHQAIGSVHAPDAQGALLNARHVFVRRPAAVSLWVAPAFAVHSWSAEELERGLGGEPPEPEPADESRTFLVFVKTSNRRAMTFVDHVGDVTASGPLAALQAAREKFAVDPALVWWLVPASQITASAADEVASWFEPARDKTYKQQSAYGRVRPKADRSRS